MSRSNSSRCFWTRDQAGFTLVELMVVVAIIGLLVTIAIPNYRKFTNRSRQTEAKIALGAVYTAERSFSAEQMSYTLCIRAAGFIPEGSLRFYAIGFNQPVGANLCGPSGDRVCNAYAFAMQAPAPAASYAVNDTTCPMAMGDPANPLISTAFGANSRGQTSTLPVPAASPEEDTAFPGGPGGCPVNQSSFTACAAAALEGGNYDRWTMNENGELTNVASNI